MGARGRHAGVGEGKKVKTQVVYYPWIYLREDAVCVYFSSRFLRCFFFFIIFLKHTYTALDRPWFIVSVRFDGARMLFNVNHCRLVIHDWRHLKCWKLGVTGSVAWAGEEETSVRKTPPPTCTAGSQTPSFYSFFFTSFFSIFHSSIVYDLNPHSEIFRRFTAYKPKTVYEQKMISLHVFLQSQTSLRVNAHNKIACYLILNCAFS